MSSIDEVVRVLDTLGFSGKYWVYMKYPPCVRFKEDVYLSWNDLEAINSKLFIDSIYAASNVFGELSMSFSTLPRRHL